jgi:hypothetical protein
MMHLLRRAGLVAGATTATIALTASASFAHECYIANQSTKAQSGLHSQVWFQVDLVGSLVDEGIWTAAQGECVETAAAEQGVRTVITIMGKVPKSHDGVLGSKNPNVETKAGDGKGVDHFFSGGAIVPLIMIAEGCGAPIPED